VDTLDRYLGNSLGQIVADLASGMGAELGSLVFQLQSILGNERFGAIMVDLSGRFGPRLGGFVSGLVMEIGAIDLADLVAQLDYEWGGSSDLSDFLEELYAYIGPDLAILVGDLWFGMGSNLAPVLAHFREGLGYRFSEFVAEFFDTMGYSFGDMVISLDEAMGELFPSMVIQLDNLFGNQCCALTELVDTLWMTNGPLLSAFLLKMYITMGPAFPIFVYLLYLELGPQAGLLVAELILRSGPMAIADLVSCAVNVFGIDQAAFLVGVYFGGIGGFGGRAAYGVSTAVNALGGCVVGSDLFRYATVLLNSDTAFGLTGTTSWDDAVFPTVGGLLAGGTPASGIMDAVLGAFNPLGPDGTPLPAGPGALGLPLTANPGIAAAGLSDGRLNMMLLLSLVGSLNEGDDDYYYDDYYYY